MRFFTIHDLSEIHKVKIIVLTTIKWVPAQSVMIPLVPISMQQRNGKKLYADAIQPKSLTLKI